MDEQGLPFKVDQLVEAKSFLQGYRGAWFCCKIIDIRQKDSGVQYALQYNDFPDEKLKWTKAYQYPKPRHKNRERQLMVRPCFPSVYRESKLSDVKTISEVVVIVNDVWKVGDFVDWWADGCYWSGRLSEALGNDKFKIALLPPPAGEGSIYDAYSKDFRPSLSWSLEHGWTVPIPLGINNHHSCARLIRPVNQGCSANLAVHAVDEMREDPKATVKASFELNPSFSSHITNSSLPPPHRSEEKEKRPSNPATSYKTLAPGRNIGLDVTNGGIAKTSCSDSISSSHVRGTSAELAENTGGKDNADDDAPLKKMRTDGEDSVDNDVPMKKMRTDGEDSFDNDAPVKEMITDGGMCLNCTCSDTIAAAILDLQGLVNWVKRMNNMLASGTPLPNTAGTS